MEKYLIFYIDSTNKKRYVEDIYRNSISTDSDIGDAIEFFDKDTALIVCNYLNKRDNDTTKYKVLCQKTILEEVN